jgi:hypothetical protein
MPLHQPYNDGLHCSDIVVTTLYHRSMIRQTQECHCI